MRKFFLLLAIVTGSCVTTSRSLKFSFPVFNNSVFEAFNSGNNSGFVALDAIQVTPNVHGATMENRVGRTLFNKRFMLWRKKGKNTSFYSTFTFTIMNQTDPGGEGLAFILTSDPSVPPESHGQWLGIVSPKLDGSTDARSPRTVAIEFDTRKSFPSDVDDNHIGLDINSVYSTKQFPLNFKLSRGFMTHVTVQYDSENLSVNVSNNETTPSLMFSEKIDLSMHLPKYVYVGFSASTSNFTQINCVNSWTFSSDDKGKTNSLVVHVGLAVSVTIFFSVAVAVIVWCWLRDSKRINEDKNSIEDEIGRSTVPKGFKYMELSMATDGFNKSNFLGEGGFGTVYKGVMNGDHIAVKKIKKGAAQGKKEFIAEVTTIGNMSHGNLVKLVGWCCEKAEYLLVYEYMANGSLDRFISSENQTLSLKTRIHVLSGVAQAVAYLHGGCGKIVFHRDIKPSNILLDSKFNAKLGDFGLARTIKDIGKTHHSTSVLAGTMGYLAPELPFTRRSTAQTDVYSYGVVTLEVASGRRVKNEFIVNWVWDLYEKNKICDAADTLLKEESSNQEEMQCLLMLGLACCHPNPFERPSMNAVVQMLRGEAPVPEVQKERPRFVWPVLSSVTSDLSFSGSQLDSIDGR